MSQDAALLSSDCLLHTFYVCIQFLLACPSLELHLIGDISNDLPVDIRLHDFRLRYRLDLTCLTQLIRTVHAARHAAYHFSNWSLKRGTNSIEEFTYHTFGSDVDVAEIQDMVRDGQRLGQIEYQCGSAYASFIVALDWHRFQATPDSQLLQLTNDLLSAPAVQGLLGLLMPQWPADSFGRYHGSLGCHRGTHMLTEQQNKSCNSGG